jgi:hypothetical protein
MKKAKELNPMLTLVLTGQWFDAILNKGKREEYRKICPRYLRQFFTYNGHGTYTDEEICEHLAHPSVSIGVRDVVQHFDIKPKPYTHVRFFHAYFPAAVRPEMHCMISDSIRIGTGNPEWGADAGVVYFVIPVNHPFETHNISS